MSTAREAAGPTTEARIKGPLTLFLGDERLSVETGDAATIPRKAPHRWQNDSHTTTEVLLVSPRLLH